MTNDPKRLLKEYLHLVLETTQREPFEILGPVKPATHFTGGLGVYRVFPLVVNDELKRMMNVHPDELEGDVVVGSEHEIVIEPEPKGGWTPVSINGVELSLDDMDRLKAYMGPLTDREMERLEASSF